ncbi:probable cytochrome P450 303a1 isoform X2 [Leptopilina heterotoma]|nr:probable cytochrome P450 303a1 isoform X2 [Leptopilina heterotoma]
MRSMCLNDICDGKPFGPVYEVRTFGKRLGLILTDGNLWNEQRRFVVRHLREFGFGKTSMATLIEEEAQHLADYFKKLIRRTTSSTRDNLSNDNNNSSYNNNKKSKDGQIYQLIDEMEMTVEKKEKFKPMKLENVYAKAEDYEEIRRLSQPKSVVISMHDAFGVPVLNTLWRMMAGRRYNTDDKPLKHLLRILNKLLGEIDMIGSPFGHFPFLRYIAPKASGYKAFLETHQELWHFIKVELQNHKETFDPNSPRDLMDTYLQVLQSEKSNETFSESQLLAICVDLFMAGSETTSKTIGFCFLYLVLNPEVQKKAQDEIDSVTSRKRLPTLNDKSRMTYVNAIVYESLRIFMGKTMNVPHRAIEDTYILGHRIPKDTMIVVNFNRVLMDYFWDDSEAFRPERFIDDEGKLAIPEQFLPFSFGKHRCMGEVLAKSNIFVMVATLLSQFTFSVVPGEEKPISSEFIDGVTAGPLPYRALVTLRN